MQSELAASIVIYKTPERLWKSAVKSFLESYPGGHVFLIVNSPSLKTAGIPLYDRRIEYIANRKNIGFGAAHNVAIRMSQQRGYPFHLVLNPDVYFKKEVIPSLLRMMGTHADVGLAMPKVLYPDGRIQHLCKLLPSPQHLLIRRFIPFHGRFLPKMSQDYELKFSGYDRVMDVPCLSGCFMMLRNDCLKKIGLFDEGIFLYTEDIDLSRRIHKHFRTVYFPEVSIYHHHERGSYKRLMPFLFHVSSAITYFNKWGWFHDPERDAVNQKTLYQLSKLL